MSQDQTPKETLMKALLKELDEELDVLLSRNDECLIMPWLMTTQWHEYTAATGLNTQTLQSKVAIPKDNDPAMPGLHSLVDVYFQEALALLQSTDELVLQCLNSPDPDKK